MTVFGSAGGWEPCLNVASGGCACPTLVGVVSSCAKPGEHWFSCLVKRDSAARREEGLSRTVN